MTRSQPKVIPDRIYPSDVPGLLMPSAMDLTVLPLDGSISLASMRYTDKGFLLVQRQVASNRRI